MESRSLDQRILCNSSVKCSSLVTFVSELPADTCHVSRYYEGNESLWRHCPAPINLMYSCYFSAPQIFLAMLMYKFLKFSRFSEFFPREQEIFWAQGNSSSD